MRRICKNINEPTKYGVRRIQYKILDTTIRKIKNKYRYCNIFFCKLSPNAKKVWNKIKEDHLNEDYNYIKEWKNNSFEVYPNVTKNIIKAYINSYFI